MDSAEIATTTDEMEAELYVENGAMMDAKTTYEITRCKDAEMLETETRVPLMAGEVPSHHLVSPRARVTLMKSAGSYHAGTMRGLSADHVTGDH